jgi:hypothetical protein
VVDISSDGNAPPAGVCSTSVCPDAPSWACEPAYRPAPLTMANTVYKKRGMFSSFTSAATFPTSHHSRPGSGSCFVCSCSSSTRPPRALLTLLLLLFRASARLLLLLLRCLPRPTTPTGTASARRSVGPQGGSPPALPPAMATVTRCRQRRRPHRDTMHVASATIQMFQ